MVGGPSWATKVVHEFMGSSFYVIPCGAVPKGVDPHGRIILDSSFAADATGSLNSRFLDNSELYISFTERVRAFSQQG